MKYDIVVIGGGVIGAAVLDKLAAFDISCLLIEKNSDVATGTSRANSGIVHAGYDCEPGTQKACFNVHGNELMWPMLKELRVPYLKCGSLVVAEEDGAEGIKKLYEKGVKNGVKTVILDRKEILKIEPNVADRIECALYAPEAGVVSPYQLTIALADRAIINGAEILTETEVYGIKKNDKGFVLQTTSGDIEASTVINCAGSNGAYVNKMAGAEEFETEFRRGEYFVLDNTERKNVNTVIFPLPTAAGKGVLVAPTADGNVIYGPTSTIGDKDGSATSLVGLEEIKRSVPLTYKTPNFAKCIRVYSGNRTLIGHDFIVKKSSVIDKFIMAIGICSPGLTSAPAIAECVANLAADYIDMKPKESYAAVMPDKKRFVDLSPRDVANLVDEDERWGRIVCRCEKVTEAEIVRAIHSPLPAVTVDAVKRRVRAGMGRCQGGFCATRVMQLLARELNVPLDEIRKGEKGSNIAVCRVGETGNGKIKNDGLSLADSEDINEADTSVNEARYD